MLLLLTYYGLGYFNSMVNSFPHHLLSFISCFLIIVVVVLNLLDKAILRIIALFIVALFSCLYIFWRGGITDSEFETYQMLGNYGITFVGKIYVSSFTSTNKGNV